MIPTYSPGDMERFVRGQSASSLDQRMMNLLELSMEMYGREFEDQDIYARNQSTMINDFGDEGNEYIPDSSYVCRGLEGKEKRESIADVLMKGNSFPVLKLFIGTENGNQAQNVMNVLLSIHGLDPSKYGDLWGCNGITAHPHTLNDQINGRCYKFLLPAQSEVRRIERKILSSN